MSDIPYSTRAEPAPCASDREAVFVDSELTPDLHAYCKRHDVTRYMVCLAALAILFRLYTGREKIALWGYLANRTRPRWYPLIGWFSNTCICGVSVPATSGQAVLGEARRTALGAMENQVVPMAVTWRALRRDGRPQTPSIPDWISFDYMSLRRGVRPVEPWQSSHWGYVAGVRREPSMGIVIVDTAGELALRCAYPVTTLSADGARQVLTDLQGVLRVLIRSPSAPIETYRGVLGTPLVAPQ